MRRSDNDLLRRMLGGELDGGRYQAADIPTPTPRRDESAPPCNGGDTPSSTHQACGKGNCPTVVSAPALAMVYSPRQCWQNLLDPESGLRAGSIFAELVLPLEPGKKCADKEAKTRCLF